MKKKLSAAILLFVMCIQITAPVFASSHREAPMIANDPLAGYIIGNDGNLVWIIGAAKRIHICIVGQRIVGNHWCFPVR